MTSKEAVESLLLAGLTKYAIAKAVGAFPISIDNWLTGTKMSDNFKTRMKDNYDITVDDSVPTSV